jgi:hypothetical protein
MRRRRAQGGGGAQPAAARREAVHRGAAPGGSLPRSTRQLLSAKWIAVASDTAGASVQQQRALGSSARPRRRWRRSSTTSSQAAPPPSLRTNRTRRVPHPVLIGHAAPTRPPLPPRSLPRTHPATERVCVLNNLVQTGYHTTKTNRYRASARATNKPLPPRGAGGAGDAIADAQAMEELLVQVRLRLPASPPPSSRLPPPLL